MRELSSAAARTGQLFNSAPIVQQFAQMITDSMTFDGPAPLQPLSMALSSGSFRDQRLLIGWWLPGTAFTANLPPSPEISAFFQAAERVSYAFLITIEWLRSGLPRYPFAFRLPHLDPHASRVAHRGFPNQRLPWSLEMRREPRKTEIYEDVAALIEQNPTELRFALLELRRALRTSEEWAAFVEAEGALTAEDDAILERHVNDFRTEARRLNESPSGRLMSFDHALRAAVSRCEQAACDTPHVDAYYRAFRGIDRALEDIGALISQYALGNHVQTVAPARAVWINNEVREVRIAAANIALFPELNAIVHIANDIPTLQRLARVERLNVEGNHRTGEQMNLILTSIESGEEATPQLAHEPESGGFVRELFV